MIREIAVQDLRVGMFVKKVKGPWMQNPFWRNEFLLSAKELELIRSSAVTRVWIDCARGAAPADDAADAPRAPAPTLLEAAQGADLAAGAGLAGAELAEGSPGSWDQELARAAVIIRRAQGAVHDMIQDARMGRAVDLAAASRVAQEIADSVARNRHALISLARLKTADQYTYLHSVAVCALMAALARQLNLGAAEVGQASLAGLMHDLGKAEVAMDILNKPDRLTDAEFAIVREHPRLGHAMLLRAGVSDTAVLDVCLHHHEKLDGSGYPEALDGPRLSLMARMGAICDVYDAITSNRPYKRGWDPAESLKRMNAWCGSHLDTQVFHAFVRTLGIYPVGSLVRLDNGMLAVVVEQGSTTLLKPRIKAFFSIADQAACAPVAIDLADPLATCKIVQREDPADWPLGDWNRLWAGEALDRLAPG